MNTSFFVTVLFIHLFGSPWAIAKNKSPVNSWALANIETERAREFTAGHSANSPTVAVVDTGVDSRHPQISENLWTNPGEIAGNGIDDDGNGFVDDVHGWNFVDNSNDLTDHHGHGTHVAGIISEVSPRSRLMILKYYDAKASAAVNIENTVKALRYAIQMKAQIINFSGGGPGFNASEYEALLQAEKKRILVIAAAGNDGVDTDIQKYYPADYGLSNIMAVTAIDRKNQTPFYANFGVHSVDIAAPGDEIPSSLPAGLYGQMSGTSQATAFVSGAAALWLSQSGLPVSPSEVITQLKASGSLSSSLIGKLKSPVRLNAFRALAMKDSRTSAEGLLIGNLEKMDQALFMIRPSR